MNAATCLANIGPRGRQRRLGFGIVILVLAALAAAALYYVHAQRIWRLALFLPFWIGARRVQAVGHVGRPRVAQSARHGRRRRSDHERCRARQVQRQARQVGEGRWYWLSRRSWRYSFRSEPAMRILPSVTGVRMVLIGAIWLLQGINLLKGSPMTGQTRWVVIGAAVVVAGLVLLMRVNRRKQRP